MLQIFRQFYDKQSSTYTYFYGDVVKRQAVLIDTVRECVKRDLDFINEFKFEDIHLLSTHIHADHVTGNALVKEAIGPKAISFISKYYEDVAKADVYLEETDEVHIGDTKLECLHTPGHTSGCMSFIDHKNKRVFTGDTLLIRGCGRTDFQGGSSEQLYESVHNKLFKLPLDYEVYPAHDYNGRTSSSIYEETQFNPRLTKTKEEFINIMANLNLAYPKLIDVAVPLNLNCGYEGAKS